MFFLAPEDAGWGTCLQMPGPPGQDQGLRDTRSFDATIAPKVTKARLGVTFREQRPRIRFNGTGVWDRLSPMSGTPSRHHRAHPASPEERRLIQGLREEDPASYGELLNCYGGRMLAVARRIMQNEDDAQDCVQEAFLQAFRKIDTFEERASLGSWLHRIVVNAALMKIRQRNRRQETPLEDHLCEFDAKGGRKTIAPELTTAMEGRLESLEIQTIIRREIDDLPTDFRNIILLRDIEEYDTAETATLLGISLSSTKTRLHRARAALKRKVEKRLTMNSPQESKGL